MVIKNKQRSITVSWPNFKLKEVDSLSIGHQKLLVCKQFNTTAFIFNTFSVKLIHFSCAVCHSLTRTKSISSDPENFVSV